MTNAKPDDLDKKKETAPGEVLFICRRCGQERPISEMRVITRFFPMEIVCRGCEKAIR